MTACPEPKLLDSKKGVQIGDVKVQYEKGGIVSQAANVRVL